MYEVDRNTYRSRGFNQRVRFLIFHYTALDFEKSIRALAGDSQVSAHYLVPDPTDPTYAAAGFSEIKIFNLVDEKDRAWHAGVSGWAGRTNLNDSSIGIEIVNLATDNGGQLHFPPYDKKQIDAVKQIARDILRRYPDITPTQVIGHSDVAPGRKSDPGAAFPWKELYDEDIGAWYDEQEMRGYEADFKAGRLPGNDEIIAKLKRYGYDTSGAGGVGGLSKLIRAFQLHFRPQRYDGTADAETVAILYALVSKYFPG